MGVYELSGSRGANDPLCVKIPDAMDSDEYLLEFELPDATSPKKLGLGGDGRELGFSFQKITFEREGGLSSGGAQV